MTLNEARGYLFVAMANALNNGVPCRDDDEVKTMVRLVDIAALNDAIDQLDKILSEAF